MPSVAAIDASWLPSVPRARSLEPALGLVEVAADGERAREVDRDQGAKSGELGQR